MTISQLVEFRKIIQSTVKSERKPDKQTRKLLFYLFTGTRGGFTRLRIIMLLLARSYNTHQLSQELQLNYKAIQHHIRVLEKNNMIIKIGEKYGAIFCLSDFLEINIGVLDEIIDKLDQNMNQKKIYL